MANPSQKAVPSVTTRRSILHSADGTNIDVLVFVSRSGNYIWSTPLQQYFGMPGNSVAAAFLVTDEEPQWAVDLYILNTHRGAAVLW